MFEPSKKVKSSTLTEIAAWIVPISALAANNNTIIPFFRWPRIDFHTYTFSQNGQPDPNMTTLILTGGTYSNYRCFLILFTEINSLMDFLFHFWDSQDQAIIDTNIELEFSCILRHFAWKGKFRREKGICVPFHAAWEKGHQKMSHFTAVWKGTCEMGHHPVEYSLIESSFVPRLSQIPTADYVTPNDSSWDQSNELGLICTILCILPAI